MYLFRVVVVDPLQLLPKAKIPRVLLPAAAPAPLVNTLHGEIARQLNSADVRARLAADGAEAVANTPAAFAAILRDESKRWAQVIKETGLRAD